MTSELPVSKYRLRFGAIAVLDVLGFKGIWARCKPELVVEKLQGLWEVAPKFTKEVTRELFSLKTGMVCLSDALVLSAQVSGVPATTDARQDLTCKIAALATVCSQVVCLWRGMLLVDGPPMLYRGAISLGAYFYNDRFLIGPAVDEAAEHEKRIQAALVCLCPTAEAVAAEFRSNPEAVAHDGVASLFSRSVIMECPVPLKDIYARYQAGIVNPFGVSDITEGDSDYLVARVAECFDVRSEDADETVLAKHWNTMKFLRRARGLDAAMSRPRSG